MHLSAFPGQSAKQGLFRAARAFIGVIALVMSLGAASTTSHAATTFIDPDTNAYAGAAAGFWGEDVNNFQTMGQTFEPESIGGLDYAIVTEVRFRIQEHPTTTGRYQAYIYQWDEVNHHATGAALWASAVQNLPVGGMGAQPTIVMAVPNVTLTPGNVYVFLITVTGVDQMGGTAQSTFVGKTTGDGYAGATHHMVAQKTGASLGNLTSAAWDDISSPDDMAMRITLDSLPPPVLSVATAADFVGSGPVGGPFTGLSGTPASYTVTNTAAMGSGNLAWSVSSTNAYLTFTPSMGSLAPGDSQVVTVTMNASLDAVAVGQYLDTINFLGGPGGNAMRSATIDVVPATPVMTVTTATNWTGSGPVGGPFMGAPASYTIQNTGLGTLNWTASAPAWLDLSSSMGALTAGQSTVVTVTVNATANALALGVYNGDITFTDTDNMVDAIRTATLQVGTPPALQVTGGPWEGSGLVGGPFTGAPGMYTVTNSGGGTLNWSVTPPSWLDITPAMGSLTAGQSVDLTVTVNASADALAMGDYNETISFTSDGGNDMVGALLHVGTLPLLQVTGGDYLGNGPVGGPFTGAPGGYTITNIGGGTLNWTVTPPAWLDITPTMGSLTAGQSVNLTVATNANADALAEMAYNDSIAFNSDGGNDMRAATLTVVDSVGPTVQLIGEFLENRAHMILTGEPDRGRRLGRFDGGQQTAGISAYGVTAFAGLLPFSANFAQGQESFSASLIGARKAIDRFNREQLTSLASPAQQDEEGEDTPLPNTSNQVALAPTQEDELGASDAPLLDGEQVAQANGYAEQFDIWIEGQIAGFDGDRGDGQFSIVHIGADYLITPNLLLGFGAQLDWATQDDISGFGFLVGPYATARLNENFFIDLRAGWGRSSNDVSPLGTYEDNFGATRWLVSGALIGQFPMDGWTISPEARLNYFREDSDAYIDSLGAAIPEVSVEMGEFTFGPEIETSFMLDEETTISPFASLDGIWTFSANNSAGAAGALSDLGEEGFRGRFETGATISFDGGTSLGLSGFYDGLGSASEFQAWGGELRFSIIF